MKENISAANLIKQSCKQICYFRKKKEFAKPTQKQQRGIEHQEKVSISEYKEMRGCYETTKHLIFFSFDEVLIHENKLILKEHKMVEGSYEDWYEQYSILQTAVYHQLALMQEKKELFTAKFFQKQGYTTKYLNYEDKQLVSILSMGEKKLFSVKPLSTEIVSYFVKKLEASYSYETAEQWDIKYKFKDWQQLNKFVEYRQIK